MKKSNLVIGGLLLLIAAEVALVAFLLWKDLPGRSSAETIVSTPPATETAIVMPVRQQFLGIITATASLTQTQMADTLLFPIQEGFFTPGQPLILRGTGLSGYVRLALVRPVPPGEVLHTITPTTTWGLLAPDHQGPETAVGWQLMILDPVQEQSTLALETRPITLGVLSFANNESSPDDSLLALNRRIVDWNLANPEQKLWVDYLLLEAPGNPNGVLYAFSPVEGSPAGPDAYCAFCKQVLACHLSQYAGSTTCQLFCRSVRQVCQ
jgi:hypothetical protein